MAPLLTKSSMSEALFSEAKLLKASKIGRYPVQRQMLPSRISSICAAVGDGLSVRRLETETCDLNSSTKKLVLGCVNSRQTRNHAIYHKYKKVYFVVCVAPVHGHDESRCAVSALRAVVAHEPRLHLVQVVRGAHALHGRDGPTVALQERRYAL